MLPQEYYGSLICNLGKKAVVRIGMEVGDLGKGLMICGRSFSLKVKHARAAIL